MPPKKFFTDQTFAFSGRLTQPKKEYEELVQKYGGEVANAVNHAVTFLVSTEDDVKARTKKVAIAKGRKVSIVSEDFVLECIKLKRLLEPGPFSLLRKRTSVAEVAPVAKRAKAAPVTTPTTVSVNAKSGLKGKAAVVQEEVSKGFIKASLTWDVELVLNDPAKLKDKFFNLQLLANEKGTEFWVVRHYGYTGMEGRAIVDGPFPNVATAKSKFRKFYRSKTGNVWIQLGESIVEEVGKYKLLIKGAEPEAPGLWQYHLHNTVDGKKIAWYDYEGLAAENMDKY